MAGNLVRRPTEEAYEAAIFVAP